MGKQPDFKCYGDKFARPATRISEGLLRPVITQLNTLGDQSAGRRQQVLDQVTAGCSRFLLVLPALPAVISDAVGWRSGRKLGSEARIQLLLKVKTSELETAQQASSS